MSRRTLGWIVVALVALSGACGGEDEDAADAGPVGGQAAGDRRGGEEPGADAQVEADAEVLGDAHLPPDAAPDAAAVSADCEEAFAAFPGRFSGRAALPDQTSIAGEFLTHEERYDFEFVEGGQMTLRGTLQGDLEYDLTGATCTPFEVAGQRGWSILWGNATRTLNLGYSEAAGTFTSFAGGFSDGPMRRGAFLFMQVTRDE